MPQLASVVLKNNAGTDQTFAPRDIVGGVATLVNSTGVPLGDKTVSILRTKTPTGKHKVTMKIVVPVIQDVVVAGITKPTVVRASYVDVAFSFDSASSTAEREDVLAYAKSLLAEETLVAPVIELLQSPY